MAANDEVIRLLLDMGVSKENVQAVVDKLDALEDKAKKVVPALEKTEKATVNLGQTALQGGRFLQDFAQGGIGGVLNNIEGLATALGGGPGLAGVMTAVGLAAYFALPKIKDFITSFTDPGANKIPESADHVGKLADALGEIKKQLDEYRKQQSLTNSELAKFNELTAKQVGLEKELDESRKQRKREEEFKGIKEGPKEQQSADLAAGMKAQAGGHQDEMVGEISGLMTRRWLAAMRGKYQEYSDRFRRNGELSEGDMADFQRIGGELEKANRGEYFDRFIGEAQAELARAASGDVGAYGRLMGLYKGHPHPADSVTHERLRMAGPEEARARRQATADAERQRKDHAEADAERKQWLADIAKIEAKTREETEKAWHETPEQWEQRVAKGNPQAKTAVAKTEPGPGALSARQRMALEREQRRQNAQIHAQERRRRQHITEGARKAHQTPEEFEADQKAREFERQRKAATTTPEDLQRKAIALQRRLADPEGFSNDRQEAQVRARLAQLQSQLGPAFPVMQALLGNQQQLNQNMQALANNAGAVGREIRRVGGQIQGVRQQQQTALNMGGPF